MGCLKKKKTWGDFFYTPVAYLSDKVSQCFSKTKKYVQKAYIKPLKKKYIKPLQKKYKKKVPQPIQSACEGLFVVLTVAARIGKATLIPLLYLKDLAGQFRKKYPRAFYATGVVSSVGLFVLYRLYVNHASGGRFEEASCDLSILFNGLTPEGFVERYNKGDCPQVVCSMLYNMGKKIPENCHSATYQFVMKKMGGQPQSLMCSAKVVCDGLVKKLDFVGVPQWGNSGMENTTMTPLPTAR